MKIHIWIKKEDALRGIITEYHNHLPQVSYSSYVQVSISVDEYTQLEDEYKEKHTTDFRSLTDTDCNYTAGIDGPGIETNEFERHCLDNQIDPYLQTK